MTIATGFFNSPQQKLPEHYDRTYVRHCTPYTNKTYKDTKRVSHKPSNMQYGVDVHVTFKWKRLKNLLCKHHFAPMCALWPTVWNMYGCRKVSAITVRYTGLWRTVRMYANMLALLPNGVQPYGLVKSITDRLSSLEINGNSVI
jgi:hypothetical protein